MRTYLSALPLCLRRLCSCKRIFILFLCQISCFFFLIKQRGRQIRVFISYLRSRLRRSFIVMPGGLGRDNVVFVCLPFPFRRECEAKQFMCVVLYYYTVRSFTNAEAAQILDTRLPVFSDFPE
ncbi:Guanine nucleotide exchange factor DBS [Frankliniella fusca]|uniref:Guanine nucleotide exchange factor DBS n=1 Tax=Frankliniella fusca TaxID=407009 RepID=A0AAE1H481_9NEOP|nr:Guanine nucleotide exchange factor DBS [Frankliniella fusca]